MFPRLLPPCLCALALLAAACSPPLNWRTVTLDGPGLELLLPCKPERAERTVEWAQGQGVVLSMTGCDADGTTFAVSVVRVDDPARAPAMLAQWQAAVRARLQPGAVAEGAAVPPVPAAAFVPRGALTLPQSVRMRLQGHGAGGRPVLAEAAWFARQQAGHAWLYHALAFDTAAPAEGVQTFFESLRLQ